MKIKNRPEYGNKPVPLTCGPDMTVLAAVKLMAEKNFGSIIVVDAERRVLGLMTERDIFKRVMAPELDPATTKVEQVMSTELRKANEEDDLTDWLRIMSNERFRRLPVVDNEDRLVSVMSQGDFVSYTWPQLLNQVSTLAKSTVSKNSQQSLIVFGIIAYALITLTLVVVSLR
ncbi:CBS domain-containing protein [Litorimonas sp. WD9-15]|uniref:CBS domain-containing protein n=1 Tax=Litorimonas sp. WD9-15 TaxID=3418716 RepID=UPI003D0436CB